MDEDRRYKLLLGEYEQMRAEINNRTRLQMNLVLAALTALGAGVSVADTFDDALLGVAAIISILSFLWSDHDKQIATVGAYVALRLEGPLQEASTGFTWERFFRDMDKGREAAADQLYPREDPRHAGAKRVRPDKHILKEYALLFYLVPFILLLIYGIDLCDRVTNDHVSGLPWADRARIAATLFAGALLGASYWRHLQRKARRDVIEKRVTEEYRR